MISDKLKAILKVVYNVICYLPCKGMRKLMTCNWKKRNMIFPLLLQSSKCHDEMITEMSDELRVTLTEEV